MKAWLYVLIAIVSCSCAVSNQFAVMEYEVDKSDKLPLPSLLARQPGKWFLESCEAFKAQSDSHHCSLHAVPLHTIETALRETGIFTAKRRADESRDYRLLIATANYTREEEKFPGTPVMSLPALLPSSSTSPASIHVDALLLWRNHPLAEFQYDIPYELQRSLLGTNKDHRQGIAKSVASHLAVDFQSGEVFSTRFLVDRLQTSNYSVDLQAPQRVKEFVFDEAKIYRDPFRGAMLRFHHRQLQFDHIDVFIYPIRDKRRADTTAQLRAEADTIRQDISRARKEKSHSDPHFESDTVYKLNTQDRQVDVLRFQSSSTDKYGGAYITHNYLTILEDKFIRVQAPFFDAAAGPYDMDSFVARLLQDIEVPDESQFMAGFRQRWQHRDSR